MQFTNPFAWHACYKFRDFFCDVYARVREMGLVSSSSEIRTDVELPLSEIAGLMIQVAKIDYLGAYRLPRLISGRRSAANAVFLIARSLMCPRRRRAFLRSRSDWLTWTCADGAPRPLTLWYTRASHGRRAPVNYLPISARHEAAAEARDEPEKRKRTRKRPRDQAFRPSGRRPAARPAGAEGPPGRSAGGRGDRRVARRPFAPP